MVSRLLLLVAAVMVSLMVMGVSSHRLLSKVDPRRSLGGQPPMIAHSRWEAGRSYTFEFTSKAAHIEKELPSSARVNPQTAIEDLGLWPFAILGGKLTLSCSCRAAPGEADGGKDGGKDGSKAAAAAVSAERGPVFCQATIHGVRHECGRDVSRSGTTCAQLNDLAAELPVWPFGLVFGADGQLLEVRHHNLEGAQAAGIKQNLVVDLGVAPPTLSEGYNARYTRSGTVGNVTVTTTYRVRPYTQMAHVASPPVDGLMVNKFRQSFVQPPEGANTTSSFLHRRRAWAYIVVGGDSEFEEAVAVPTRVASTEEAEVDPAVIPRAFNTTTLYVLSRLELNLRATGTVEPGTVPCPYHTVKEVADGKKAPAAAAPAVFGAEADKKEAVDAAADKATQQGAKELVEALNKGGAAPAPEQESSSSASDEVPTRVSPTSFLQTDEMDAAAVDPLAAFRSVADGLEGVLAPVEAGAARPMADRVMADTGDRAFAELLDAEATSFNAHNVAVGKRRCQN